jgi:hypothetical protein
MEEDTDTIIIIRFLNSEGGLLVLIKGVMRERSLDCTNPLSSIGKRFA